MGRVSQFILHLKALRALQVFQPSLYQLLSRFHRDLALEERIQLAEDVIEWIRVPGQIASSAGNHESIQNVRVEFLLNKVEQSEEVRAAVSKTLQQILIETDSSTLFTQTGLRRQRGFLSEAFDRLVFQFLPRPVDEKNLAQIFGRLFDDEGDPTWIRQLTPQLVARLIRLACPDEATRSKLILHFAHGILDSLAVLSTQIAAQGLSPEIRMRSSENSISNSPFLSLNTHLIRTREAGLKGLSETTVLLSSADQHIQLCREQLRSTFSHLEDHGVSVDLVYRLELLDQYLKRCEALVHLLTPVQSEHADPLALFVGDLVQSHFESTHLSELIQDNIHLLSRKIVERSGETGEHYITRTSKEYWEMLLSAGGGGIVTVGTAFLKFTIAKLHAALFFEGLFFSMNYAGSFLLMQAFHLTLATKQPSMTAPALAGKLRDLKGRDQLLDFVHEIARITRSQFAAALGNVGFVIPGCILFDFVYKTVFHHHVLTAEYGHKTLESFHLLTSPTVPFAMFTGVLLWMGSISAGWVENWTVYHRLPEAIAQSRSLKKIFGAQAPGRLSAWFTRNISGIAGNVFFGLYLGFVPVFGRFFGLPLDVRHVTLSTGALTFSICAQGLSNIDSADLTFACLGVVAMLLCNFGVSFALALWVAMKARRIKTMWLSHLTASIWAYFRVKPLDFFYPTEKKR